MTFRNRPQKSLWECSSSSLLKSCTYFLHKITSNHPSYVSLVLASTAAQFVIEEKILSRYSVEPLVAVGFEGLFGAISILLCMPLLAQYSDRSSFFDLPRGWHQMIDNPPVLYSGIAIAISISLFNFFGLSVTRYVSATSRSLTDTCRTLSIWIISLALGWEKLLFPISLLQVLGFSLLVYGTVSFFLSHTPPTCFFPSTFVLSHSSFAHI